MFARPGAVAAAGDSCSSDVKREGKEAVQMQNVFSFCRSAIFVPPTGGAARRPVCRNHPNQGFMDEGGREMRSAADRGGDGVSEGGREGGTQMIDSTVHRWRHRQRRQDTTSQHALRTVYELSR